MKARGIDSVVLTRGAKPTLFLTADGGFIEVATLPVEPVDTVGAGDAFAGVFCAFMAGGAEPARALAAGNCAGALTTLKAGAQESVPNRKRLLSAMSAL